ncbi:G5 domain-containing protein [Anaerococcus sp. Marseille-P3915]|uniref:G5 domain-containing protein n=1 Tax=Anaerococcus sp. Marseille-P3915 TaxID=2057799 RepID=UPI000D0B5D61|nr:G5 domain-containing protein [Anaerococcus sp. Marseille-P3915]
MNKKQNLLAIAISASFIIGGANVAQASENTTAPVVEENITSQNTPSAVNQDNQAANVNTPQGNDEKEEEKEEKQTPNIKQDAQTEEEAFDMSDASLVDAQGAGEGEAAKEEDKHIQKATDPNYGEDEGKIKDYNKSERYKETDLQPGDTNQESNITDQGEAKDGLEFNTKNPSADTSSKTEYGYQITIDKKTGQRTYTKVYVTDSGLIPVDEGEKQMMDKGEKLTSESPDVTYKPNENTKITASRSQRNLNYEASEETLKHINNKDNDFTSLGFEDNYTSDNPRVKFFKGSFALGYKVNPWPNENDKLEQLKLNGQYNEKVFVQGQEIDTGIKVDNIDESAKERLVGQVYNPITGKVVPGASAYIKNGTIHIQMPEGALKKDKSGKTVINDDSIFNTDDYKALQNLDVKFFARPRTAEEFTKIAETPDEFGEKGTYTGSEAGTADINHKGKNVTIDKQGIDRYDHYNLIGGFKLNLDDTRYYDQSFEDEDGKGTEGRTYLDVKPGKDFTVKMSKPTKPSETDKSAEEMNEADKKGEASGRIIMDFINKENEGKAEKDKWKLEVDPHDISKFTVKPPKSAKAGDFIAVPVEYTYTNGSKDVHYFHFVVKESTYIKPEYDAQVNFPVNEQTSEATVAQDTKRISPDHYTLPDTLETDEAGNKLATDDKGNKWTVKVDEKTGKVTAKPVDPTAFDGGEKLTVPVISHYVDKQKPGEDITEEANAYFVIEEKANMTPRYNARAGKSGDKLSSDVILNTEDKYNRRPGKYTLDSPTYTDDKGNTWNVSIDEETGKVTATVPNEEEGKKIDGALLNVPVTAHYYEEDAEGNKVEAGTKTTEVQFVAYGTNGKVEKTEEIPFDTIVKKDPELKKGEIKVITEGEKGSKKVTYTIEDSKITDTKEEELKAPQERLIHVGEGVADGNHEIKESSEIAFETEIQFDDSLAPGETKVEQEGELGKKTRTTIINIQDGNVTSTVVGDYIVKKEPVKKIIKVGRNTEGKVEHKEELPFKYKVEEVDTLKKGEYKIVKPGKVGTKTTTWTIKNSKVDGEPTVTEVGAEDALIQVGKGTNDGTHEVKEKKNIDYKTIIEYDENLDAGQQEVVKEGNPGEQERTNTLVIKDGQVTETKEGEFKTTKEATDRVVKIGTKPITKVVEKPFNTEYVYDENMEAGKTEEVTPGKNGKVTITTSYDKDQKKVVTSETEEAGQNRVVKIGGKTNGTEKVKEEIPFEVEVRKDPSLKKGEWKYAKDDEGNELRGEKGEQEKTLTIENSKVTKTSEPTVTKKAKNAVVLVGEGTNDGTHEIKEKKELPFETRYEYDDSLEPGEEKVAQEGKPGLKERTNTLVIKDGKVVETKEGEFKTITEPEERIVKIGRKPTEGETTKTIEREIPYETKVIYDENLEAGFQKIENEGKPGKEEVTITQKIKDSKPDGEATETTKTITEKEDRVVRIGVKPVVKETELGHNTEYRHNPELKAGEEKVIEEGSKGSVKYTTTFNKETGKLEVKEERTEPKNKVVEYGSKTDGEFKYESEKAYDIIIRENPNLEAGKTNVIQEGKPGKTETTVKIENSKEVSRDTKTITEKQDKIIEIGTKNVCEIPPAKPDPKDPKPEEDPKNPQPEGPEDPKNPKPNEPGTPGGNKPNEPGTPGEKPNKPNEPGTPGEKPNKPNEPGTPGEKPNKPNEPGTPGEKPNKPNEPGTPGETPNKPNEPGTPGEKPNKPNEPGTPGEKPNKPNEPGTPGETPNRPNEPGKPGEYPKTPQGPKEDPKTEEKGEVSTPVDDEKLSKKENKSTNPKTGIGSVAPIVTSMGISIAGLLATKKKKKEDE